MEEAAERAYAEFFKRRENIRAEQIVFDLFRKAFVMGYMAALDAVNTDTAIAPDIRP